MNLPFFYTDQIDQGQLEAKLDEETSRHIVQVLRMKKGEQLNLTDGKGNLLTAEILDDHKKHCGVKVIHSLFIPPSPAKVTICISLLKNTDRFEWFLEKATEIGVDEIIPLVCLRTEKEKFRIERMKGICISAMLQSRQTWLPTLHGPTPFSKAFANPASGKFIAHCIDLEEKEPLHKLQWSGNSVILIGPEGDFSAEEVSLALQHNFIPVSLGPTRLRSETAGFVAATILKTGSSL